MKKKDLKQKAAYLARPLYARLRDMHKLKERTTLRNEHLLGQAMLHKKKERADQCDDPHKHAATARNFDKES